MANWQNGRFATGFPGDELLEYLVVRLLQEAAENEDLATESSLRKDLQNWLGDKASIKETLRPILKRVAVTHDGKNWQLLDRTMSQQPSLF